MRLFHSIHRCTRKTIDPDVKVYFLTASDMYHEEFRKVEHHDSNKDLFLQKPISADDLVREINKKINSTQSAIEESKPPETTLSFL